MVTQPILRRGMAPGCDGESLQRLRGGGGAVGP